MYKRGPQKKFDTWGWIFFNTLVEGGISLLVNYLIAREEHRLKFHPSVLQRSAIIDSSIVLNA